MSLPDCHSRRFFTGETALFFCAHPRLHARDHVVTEEICRVCPYWSQPAPPVFRNFTPGPPPKPRGLCLYLGEQTGWRECPGCQGSVRVKVFACGHPRHQETTVRECAQCGDHQERPENQPAEVLR
jgi:hypothetical protein